jgi:hypothetical protein
MPSTATTNRGGSNSGAKAKGQTNAQRVLRFVASSHEHRELVHQESVTLGTNTISSNPTNIDVNAYGFIQHIVLRITWTGGVAGTLATDAPFNVLQSVFLQDVNGAYFQYPIDGYSLMEENVYGGYSYRADPRIASTYAAGPTTGTFTLRIPVQVTRHNAYGALANQNAAASYKLGWTWNTSANVFSAAPTTAPVWTATAYLEAWTQPNARDLKGRPQAQLPPAHGSSQQWSYYTKVLTTGNNVIQFPRVGNTIRTIVCIARNTSGARDDTVLPTPFSLNLDGRVLTSEDVVLRKTLMGDALENGGTVDVGVLVFYFNNITMGKIGDEASDLWVPTLQSSRLELVGSVANGSGGTLEILTCDIAQVETDQSQRYVMESATGDLEHPDVSS